MECKDARDCQHGIGGECGLPDKGEGCFVAKSTEARVADICNMLNDLKKDDPASWENIRAAIIQE